VPGPTVSSRQRRLARLFLGKKLNVSGVGGVTISARRRCWEEGCAGWLRDREPEPCRCTVPVQPCSPLNLMAARSTDLPGWHAAGRAPRKHLPSAGTKAVLAGACIPEPAPPWAGRSHRQLCVKTRPLTAWSDFTGHSWLFFSKGTCQNHLV